MFYGWWILALVFLSSSFYGAAVVYGFTAFINPLVDEFGWSYTAISIIASIRGLEVGLIDIAAGLLFDRFGSRKVVFISYILVGLGFLILSRINSLALFYLLFIIIFMGGSSLGHIFVLYAIAHWFRKRLGLALGIAMAGYATGGFAVPLIVYLIDSVGLQSTFVIFGLAALILSVIMVGFLRNRPEDIGSTPDGIPEEEFQEASTELQTDNVAVKNLHRDYSLREALANPAFWILIYLGSSLSFSVLMVITHVMPYLEHIGYTRSLAGVVAMMIPVMSILGRLGVGWVSDFISVKTIFITCLICQAVGVLSFLNAKILFILVPSVILFGIAYGGGVVVRLRILKDYYGRTSIGSITGFYMGAHNLFALFGPLLGGLVFDTMGSYDIAWFVNLALLIFGMPMMLVMKNPQTPRASNPP
ncbi:MFS transporter [Chloroflexota bacterium]